MNYFRILNNNRPTRRISYLMIIKILIQKIIKYVKPKINHMTYKEIRALTPLLRALSQIKAHDWRSQ